MGTNGSKREVVLSNGNGTSSERTIARGTVRRTYSKVEDFLVDYCNRHAHPVNAVLHVLGVPAAFFGFYYLLTGRNRQKGSLLICVGYLFQYLGHKAQGNEVGEITLAKSIYKKYKQQRKVT